MSINSRMISGDVDLIKANLNGDDNLGNVLAIRAAVINNIKDDETISALTKLTDKDEWEFSANISYCAIAALDILGIKQYNGNNKTIQDLILNKFTI